MSKSFVIPTVSIKKMCENVDELDKKDLVLLLDKLSISYHNGNALVDDNTYDGIKDLLEKKFGVVFDQVGAPVVGTQIKKKLPKYMGSLNKIKDRKSLENWKKKNKGPYVLTEKVDGVSGLQNKKDLYTRGDGVVGTDISHLVSTISIPKNIGNVFARMEIVMPKDKFEEKYKDEMANARNMVSGLVNRKHFDSKAAKDLLILAYEYDNETEMKQSEQLEKLERLGYNIPYKKIVQKTDDLTIELLQEFLIERKQNANYDIDGIVVFSDVPYRPIPGENPKNAIAFKMEGECAVTIVREVQWNTSKHGLLKPRIRIDPVNLSGVTITWCTGFNAKFIIDNNICVGCTIEVTRSGDVIPFIKDVVIPGDHADMPEEDYEWTKKKYMVLESELAEFSGRTKDDEDLVIEMHGDEEYYVWYSDSAVDIRIKGENDEMRVKKLVSFFKKLEAKFVGESSLQKLYDTGHTTLHDLFNLTVDDICEIDGFQAKGATRIVEAIQNAITDAPLAKMAAASGVMGIGIGEKKIQLVVDKHPDILEIDLPVSEMTDLIKDVGGFKTLAVHFASKLPELRMFFEEHPEITLRKEKERKVVKETLKKVVTKEIVKVKEPTIRFSSDILSPSENKILTIRTIGGDEHSDPEFVYLNSRHDLKVVLDEAETLTDCVGKVEWTFDEKEGETRASTYHNHGSHHDTILIRFIGTVSPAQKKKLTTKTKKEVPIVFEDEEEEEILLCDKEKTNNDLSGKIVVFTGFRNKEAEEKIKDCGGKVTTSVSGKTDLLVVAKRYSGNAKEIDADSRGIEVITGEEFMARYM